MSFKKSLNTLGHGFNFALLFLFSQICYAGFFKLFGIDFLSFSPEKLGRLENTVTTALFVAVVAPVVEEVLFRGPVWFLVFNKRPKYLILIVLVVTSVLFGMLHIYNYDNPYNITAIVYGGTKAIGGVVFGLAVIKYNSLAVSIIAHCLVNCSLVVIMLTKV